MAEGNPLLTRQLFPGVPYRVARHRAITQGLVGCWLFNGGRDPAIDLCGNNRLTRRGSPFFSNYLGTPCMVFNTTTSGFENYDMKYPGIGNLNRSLYVRAAMLPGQTPTDQASFATLWHNSGAGIPYVKASMIRRTSATGAVEYAVDLAGYVASTRNGAIESHAMRSLIVARQAEPSGRRDYSRGYYLGPNASGSASEGSPTTYQFSIGSTISASRNSQTAISIVGLWNRQLTASEALQLDEEPYILVEPEFDLLEPPTFYTGGAPPPAPQITVTGNGNAISDGDATPSLTDHTDFGAITEGGATVSRTFTVSNPGDATLNISSVTVPTGYTKTTDLPSTIAASANAGLIVRLDNATVGTKSGDITINTDATPAAFNFAITGEVQAAPPPPPPPPPPSGATGISAGKAFGKAGSRARFAR